MGFDRGVRPIGDWSTRTTSASASHPSSARTSPTGSPRCCFAVCAPWRRASSWRYSTSCTSVDFPDPETPVTAVSVPSGMRASTPHPAGDAHRSEEHTSELQSLAYLVCRLLLEKKKNQL